MMESSDEANTKAIDPVVGGLVWVRRRNGSWWPGRILGADELPDSCLVSPRSGTPVKLLGREDASIDWYNLEKSKRVKAFRCGEYDECIEKAKAAAANPCKKTVKYARREDAILHALELESAREPKDSPEFCSRMNNPGAEQDGAEELPATFSPEEESEQVPEESSSFEDNSNSVQELSQSGVSFEEPNHIIASKELSMHGRRRKTPNDSEDDGTEGTKRMKGLEDLGMGGVSSLKRKRSQVAHVQEFLKRKSRRRQLAKVLESSVMVTVPVMCEPLASPTGSSFPGVSESKVSGFESNESKRSLSVVINNNSDSTGLSCENATSLNANGHGCDAFFRTRKQKENEISSMSELPEDDASEMLFDVPFVAEDKHPSVFVSSASQKPQVGAGAQSSQSSQVETVSLEVEELNESGSTSSGAADINISSHRIDKGTSKWQLKGKRNSRHKSKSKKQELRKFMDMDADDETNGYLVGLEARGAFAIGSGDKINCNPNLDGFLYRGKNGQGMETELEELSGGWSSGHVSYNKEFHIRGPAAEAMTPQRLLPHRQSRSTINPKYLMYLPLRNYDAGTLYDVEVEVKATYRSQHVPYISLMSKLNGRPIIGHPLAVEVLDEGFSDLLLDSIECYSSSYELDDDLVENTSALQGIDVVREVKPNRGGGSRAPIKHVTLQTRASPSKSPKSRKSGPLSKKIRKLSSLTGSKKLSEEEKIPAVAKLKGPSVACVPLKVVFSRINAALNSSMRPVHRVTPARTNYEAC